jgi:hypothetical protein
MGPPEDRQAAESPPRSRLKHDSRNFGNRVRIQRGTMSLERTPGRTPQFNETGTSRAGSQDRSRDFVSELRTALQSVRLTLQSAARRLEEGESAHEWDHGGGGS